MKACPDCLVCGKPIDPRDTALIAEFTPHSRWVDGRAYVHNAECLQRLRPEMDALLEMLRRNFQRAR